MVVEYTRYRIGEGRERAFLDAHQQAGRHLRARCLRYELTRCSGGRSWYIFRVEWESAEHLRRFRDDAAGRAFREAVNGFEHDILENGGWELTDIVHPPAAEPEVDGILPNRPHWKRLSVWILDHLDQKILVENMAEQVNMSPRNFARVFRREFEMPPGEFLDRVRVAAAQKDLREGRQSIEEIAIARGFGSSSTMRRTFYRVVGTPPSRYRDDFNPNRQKGRQGARDPIAVLQR
jgi:AraC-like DNA-binding protein/quinol monooxygenase YgiN